MSKKNNTVSTKKYLFFSEVFAKEVDDNMIFVIEARDSDEAFDKAYNDYGPQVDDMLCRMLE